jgi:hypothetical protein
MGRQPLHLLCISGLVASSVILSIPCSLNSANEPSVCRSNTRNCTLDFFSPPGPTPDICTYAGQCSCVRQHNAFSSVCICYFLQHQLHFDSPWLLIRESHSQHFESFISAGILVHLPLAGRAGSPPLFWTGGGGGGGGFTHVRRVECSLHLADLLTLCVSFSCHLISYSTLHRLVPWSSVVPDLSACHVCPCVLGHCISLGDVLRRDSHCITCWLKCGQMHTALT